MSEPSFPETVYPYNDKKLIHIGYGLQVIGLIPLFGMFGFIAAYILAFIKLPELRSPLLAAHFRWQMRTFWFYLLWWCLGWALYFVGIGILILFLKEIWVIYRIIKGWLYLHDNRDIALG